MITVLWLSSAADAFPFVNQRFRVGHSVLLEDADVSGGDDFFTVNQNYAARYAWVELYEEPSHTLVGQGWTDDDGYVQFNNLDKAKQHTLELYGLHDYNVNGERQLWILDASEVWVSALSDSFSLTSNTHLGQPPTVIGITFEADDSGMEWINAAAVASWAIYRRPGAFATASDSGADYIIKMDDPYTCDSDITTPAVYCMSEAMVYLDPNDTYAWGRKFIIVHEFAHEAEHWRLVPSPTADPYDWRYPLDLDAESDEPTCRDWEDAHSYVSFEYQSAAISEGLAHYLTAVAFNNTTEDDCRFDPGGQYQWLVGFESPLFDDQFSCEGYDPATGNPLGTDNGGIEWYYGIPAGDLFHHDPLDPLDPEPDNEPCSDNTITANRAIELDWLRFAWDADTKLGLDTQDIFDAWEAAQPAGGTLTDPWNANDAGNAGDMPLSRMENAFVDPARLTQTEWDTWAQANGIDQ